MKTNWEGWLYLLNWLGVCPWFLLLGLSGLTNGAVEISWQNFIALWLFMYPLHLVVQEVRR